MDMKHVDKVTCESYFWTFNLMSGLLKKIFDLLKLEQMHYVFLCINDVWQISEGR